MASERDRRAHRRQDMAYKLHLAGATYAEIAESKDPESNRPLYSSPGAAHNAVKAAMARHNEGSEDSGDGSQARRENAQRAVEVRRLDRLQRALWPAALGGDASAAREIRQLIIARTRLLGLDKLAATPNEKSKGDPVDELAKRRTARRAAASDS